MSDRDHLNASLRTIAKGAGIGFIGLAFGMAFGFFTRMIIARFLGPDEYGLISLGVACLSIATTIGLLGLSSGITRYVSFYKGRNDRGRIKGTITSALKISFPISLILASLLFFGSKWISVNIFDETNLEQILQIFAIAVPFWCLAQIFLRAMVGFQDVRYKVYVEDIFQNVFKVALIILLLYYGFGVLGVALGWILAIIVMPFLALYFLERRVFPIFDTKVKATSVRKELFSFSWPVTLVEASRLIFGWTGTLMLGYFITSYDVGIYNAALPTAGLMQIALASFAAIFMPVISELYSTRKYEDIRRIYRIVTKWIFTIVFPGFLLILIFSKQIMWILFGSEYVSGSTALCTLAFGYLIASGVGPTSSVLTAFGKTKIIMGCYFVGAVANLVLNLYLIPIYGINGAAIATASSYVFMNILTLLFVYKIGKVQPFSVGFFKPVLASVLACLLVYAVTKYLIGATLFVLVVMFFVFLALYFGLLLLFKSFEGEDLMIMSAIEERTGVRWGLARKIIGRFL